MQEIPRNSHAAQGPEASGRFSAAPSPAWRLFQPTVWILAAASVAGWSTQAQRVDWPPVVALIVVGLVADLVAVRLRQGMRVSTAHFAAPFAIAVAGGFAGVVAAGAVLLGRPLVSRRDWNWFDLAVNITAAGVTGLVWEAALPTESPLLIATAVVVSFATVRSFINSVWALEALAAGIKLPDVAGQISRLMLANALLFAPAMALYMQHDSFDIEGACLLALPFIATQFTTRAYGRESRLNATLEQTNLELTESLVNALDARDPYSAGHSVAVAVYARDIASEMGLSERDVQRVYFSGLLHDIGKIAVSDAVLRKPAALTDEEFREIERHPVVGATILSPSKMLQELLPGVRHHHERMDGRGYPDRLVGESIPLDARILAVADAYNAMTSSRPYRDAMPPELAIKILVQNQGTQHDTYIVSTFIRVLEARDADYAVARGGEFASSLNLVEALGSGLPSATDAGDAPAANPPSPQDTDPDELAA